MVNEKRLIDANVPLKQLSDYMEKLHCSDDYRDGLYRGMEIAESYIKNAPTVEAVEVVRCKDCKHFIQKEHGCNYFGYYSHTPWVDEVDFCSYGERREGE